MAEHSAQDLRDLRYGHPGRAVYDSSSRKWEFSRDSLSTWILKPFGSPSVPVPPSIQIGIPPLSNNAYLHTQQTKRVTRKDPYLEPGFNYLRFEARISENVMAQTFTLDPSQGELLDFGFASGEKNIELVSSVAVVPGGAAGELLCLMPMQPDRQGWRTEYQKSIESLEPNPAEAGWWSGVVQPIQQVCFTSVPYEQRTCLAIRTSSTISIFDPLRCRSANAPRMLSPSYNHPNSSRFDPNHVCTLSKTQLGQSPPTHISFNPWNQDQFAVMNRQGHWSIWELEKSLFRRHAKDVDLINQGDLPEPSREEEDLKVTLDDGWGRVMWVTDRDTIVVCNRITLGIYHVPTNHLMVETSALSISENHGWLLDIRQHPNFQDHLLVVTTSQIFWLRINGIDKASPAERAKSRVEILLSWTHFRDSEDISLCIRAFQDGSNTILLLYSRANTLVTAFWLSIDEENSLPISVSDPVRIPLPSSLFSDQSSKEAGSLTIKSVSIDRMNYRKTNFIRNRDGVPTVWDEYKNAGVRFYKLLVLLSDLSVRTSVYSVIANAGDGVDMRLHTAGFEILQPQWRKKATLTDKKAAAEDFVVGNSLGKDDTEDAVRPYKPPQWRQKTAGLRIEDNSIDHLIHDDNTWDFTRLYCQVMKDAGMRRNLKDVLDDIRSVTMQDSSMKEATIPKYLSEDLSPMLAIDNVGDDDNDDSDDDNELARTISAVAVDQLIDLHENIPNLSGTYKKIREDWITPLVSKISSETVSASDSRTKSVAAEICLASLYIPAKGPNQSQAQSQDTHNPSSTPGFSQPSQFSLPVRSSQPNPQQRTTQPSRSQLPNPPTTSQSSLTRPTPPPPPPPPPPAADPSATHLSHYAPIPAPLPPPLPTRLARLLAHWDPATNPAHYDWEATTARLRATLTRQGRQEAAAQRAYEARREKRNERVLRQVGRKVGGGGESSQVGVPSSSLRLRGVPGFTGAASQPGVGGGGSQQGKGKGKGEGSAGTQGAEAATQLSQEQSVVAQGLAVASQVEPGRFGGRGLQPARKKVKRAQGFR
ncbi:MAG: hypothetical protein Q9165_005634 [Trypethelium subeluteriae]